MDITIRNLDGAAYRKVKARAVMEGKTVAAAVSGALRAYTRDVPAGASPRQSRKSRLKSPPAPATTAGEGTPGRFVRPFPNWGASVENPLVMFEVEPEPGGSLRRSVRRGRARARPKSG